MDIDNHHYTMFEGDLGILLSGLLFLGVGVFVLGFALGRYCRTRKVAREVNEITEELQKWLNPEEIAKQRGKK